MTPELAKDMMKLPLVWGQRDCVTCAADLFAMATDVDPIVPIRGLWRTRREAERLLQQIGGWWHGFPAMFEAAGLREGDAPVAIGISHEPSPGLMVKLGDGVWRGKSARGMVVRDEVWRSWCRS